MKAVLIVTRKTGRTVEEINRFTQDQIEECKEYLLTAAMEEGHIRVDAKLDLDSFAAKKK